MPTYERDTFTDVPYTILNSHVEEIGAYFWYGFFNSNRTLISPDGRVFRSGYNSYYGAPNQIYGSDEIVDLTIPNADYRVSMDAIWLGDYLPANDTNGYPVDFPDDAFAPFWLRQVGTMFTGRGPMFDGIGTGTDTGGGNLPIGVILANGQYINNTGVNNNPVSGGNHRFYIYGRINPSNPSQCYAFGYETTFSRYVLCLNQSDTFSDGPSYDGWVEFSSRLPWSPGEQHNLELRIEGTTIKGYVDGVLVLAKTATNYSLAGRAGFEFKGGSSPVRGFHLDNFLVQSISSPTPTLVVQPNFKYEGSRGVTKYGRN